MAIIESLNITSASYLRIERASDEAIEVTEEQVDDAREVLGSRFEPSSVEIVDAWQRHPDPIRALHAMRVLEQHHRGSRLLGLCLQYCRDLDYTSPIRDRDNHRTWALAVAEVERQLLDRARELSREAARIRRALK